MVKPAIRQHRIQPLRACVPLAVISASFSAAKPAADPGNDDAGDAPKRRPQKLRQPHPPQSLAPWHTLPFMGREVHYLAAVVRHKVGTSLAHARQSWHEHRRAVRARHGQPKHSGGHHLRLPWRRRRQDRQDNQHQRRADTPQQAAEAAAQRGLQHQRDLDIRSAIAAFEEAIQLLPGNAHYLSLLSKQWSDITFIPGTPTAEAKSCAEKGLAIAEQAVAADPSCSMAHIAACVAKGRLTFFVDNRKKVELAAAAAEDTEAALAADPHNDLAHHLLGRWHTEMAQLNFVVRALIKMVFGATLGPGSHAEALSAYQRAVDLAPDRLIHRVELARTALRLGQVTRAARELQVAVGLEVEDINAHLTRLDGVEMLEELRKQGRLTEVLQPALPVSTEAAAAASAGRDPQPALAAASKSAAACASAGSSGCSAGAVAA